MPDALILFTRYPTENLVKTRLIPELGAQKATLIHSCLAQQTVRTLQQYCSDGGPSSPQLFVFFDGGDSAMMQIWLGRELHYIAQEGRELGERMHHAFRCLFARGYDRMVLVGSDCPYLDRVIIAEAFEALVHSDVTLGPATDGGYYLIGLRRPCQGLFREMAWSTPEVCQETINRCGAANLLVHLLPELSDVDTYEDWRRYKKTLGKA